MHHWTIDEEEPKVMLTMSNSMDKQSLKTNPIPMLLQKERDCRESMDSTRPFASPTSLKSSLKAFIIYIDETSRTKNNPTSIKTVPRQKLICKFWLLFDWSKVNWKVYWTTVKIIHILLSFKLFFCTNDHEFENKLQTLNRILYFKLYFSLV